MFSDIYNFNFWIEDMDINGTIVLKWSERLSGTC